MATFKVNADKLNLRSSPVKDFDNKVNVVGVLLKDSMFECVAIIENELGRWCMGEDGHFVSEKWLREFSTEDDKIEMDFQTFIDSHFEDFTLKGDINYGSLLEIDENIKLNEGKNVLVGILDHPISSSLHFATEPLKPFHVNDPLFTFHGNFISGLICGINGVIGIAKNCQLLELPIFNSRANVSGIDIDALLQFINRDDTPMLINISNTLDKKFNEQIKNFRENKIVIACAGIDQELSSNEVRDPASLPNVLSIGAISKPLSELPKLNAKIDFVVPNYGFVSYGRSEKDFSKEQGDSFSCAVVSAIIALLISSGKTGYELNSIKRELIKIASPSSTQSFKFFNIINAKS